ncbi:MAG: MotA/TolQ/ExbB proton channel family protein [Lentisphaeria bacterium]|nr:MotA/TolQ/ExbB proton channel family protein [Lentisphaeria bacterium]
MKVVFARFISGLAAMGLAGIVQAAEGGNKTIDSFGDVIAVGGPALKIIILLSAVVVFLVIYFLLSMRAGVLTPALFIEQASEAARNGDVDALRNICRTNPSPAAKVMAAATEEIDVTGRVDYLAVRDAVEDEGGRQADMLWSRLQYLMDIAGVAPMVGLLGTVFGMLKAFSRMETEVGAVRPDTLAEGVSQALITTAGGLIVGIGALILYAVFRGRVGHLVAKLEDRCGQLTRQLIANQPDEKRG